MPSIHQKACLSAPFSVCVELRIWAVSRTIVPFAISEGWNCTPNMEIHLLASFVAVPAISTHMSIMNDRRMRKGVVILKYLHLMLRVTIMENSPSTSVPECFMTGAQYLPLL